MPRAAEGGELGLERLDLRPHDELAVGQNLGDGVVERPAEATALSR